MRDLLLNRVRPLVDGLAEDLANLVLERIEAELERMTDTFSVALSAYASDGPDLLTATLGTELAREHGAQAAPAPRAPTKAIGIQPSKSTPVPIVRSNTITNHRVASDAATTSKGDARQRAVMRCRKCGALGYRSDGCGTSHQPQAPQTAVTSKPERKSTAAEIEHAKARSRDRIARIAARVGRAKTAPLREPEPDDNGNAAERWSSQRIDEERELAENRKQDGDLPRPSASFAVDDGDVQELDFGAAG